MPRPASMRSALAPSQVGIVRLPYTHAHTRATPVTSADAAQREAKPWYIAHPIYDGVLFIGAPVLALFLGLILADTALATEPISLLGREEPITDLFLGTFIMAHLGLVVVRSHANATVFRRHKMRFTVAPPALLAAMLISPAVMIVVTVVATWWDVYHSSMQTFGLGRIYDRRAGNDPRIGRRLDQGLNLLLYAGPILGGATLLDHLDSFAAFGDLGWVFLAEVPARAGPYREALTYLLAIGGGAYLIYYIAAYRRLHHAGYRVAAAKVALLVATGVCSIYAWGWNSFGEAFFVMNFFHALQYFALVWWTERGNLRRLLRVDQRVGGAAVALGALLALGFGYGAFGYFVDAGNRPLICVTLVVSIMHFWYDGFIWSVRRDQV